jgi:hypothetical protein
VVDGRGLTLLLVIRGGLWLDECLDVTVVGRNALAETSPRTFVPDQRRAADASSALSESPAIRTLCRLHRQFLRIEQLSFLPQTQGHRRDLSRQRHLGQFLVHASAD